jgi:hypothetical protein
MHFLSTIFSSTTTDSNANGRRTFGLALKSAAMTNGVILTAKLQCFISGTLRNQIMLVEMRIVLRCGTMVIGTMHHAINEDNLSVKYQVFIHQLKYVDTATIDLHKLGVRTGGKNRRRVTNICPMLMKLPDQYKLPQNVVSVVFDVGVGVVVVVAVVVGVAVVIFQHV